MCLAGTAETCRAHRHEGPILSRRRFLAAGAAGAAVAAMPKPAFASKPPFAPKGPGRLQDLTHVFSDDHPLFPGSPTTTRQTHVTIPDDGFYGQIWTFWEHSGTHMDAPGHFVEGRKLSPDIDPDELIVPLVVVDISGRAAVQPDTEVTVADLVAFERRHGRILPRSLVCMDSGWEARYDSEAAYRNTDADGVLRFPGFSLEAGEWLLERRGIQGIGVDTLSLDHGPSTTFSVHLRLLGEDRYGLENLANLSRVPARGATAFVGLIRWQEGSGGPCRVIARW
jgi:kynurenine formamidase